MSSLWTCPKCGRKFEHKNQQHSCAYFPVEKHLKGKEKTAKPLYNLLKKKIRQGIGPFRIESLPCCIHFVRNPAFTFAAVYALKDRIRIHFGSQQKLSSPRIDKSAQVSASRFMHSLDIREAKEMDSELLGWLKQAYDLKK